MPNSLRLRYQRCESAWISRVVPRGGLSLRALMWFPSCPPNAHAASPADYILPTPAKSTGAGGRPLTEGGCWGLSCVQRCPKAATRVAQDRSPTLLSSTPTGRANPSQCRRHVPASHTVTEGGLGSPLSSGLLSSDRGAGRAGVEPAALCLEAPMSRIVLKRAERGPSKPWLAGPP
jgi:hypothetical protein